MTKLNLINALFSIKEPITLTGGMKQTNSRDKNGIGYSDSRDAGTRDAAKYNGAARVLDFILADKAVAARNTDNSVYGEFTTGGTTYHFLVTKDKVQYVESSTPSGYAALVPFILYCLKNSNADIPTEPKEIFNKIKSDFIEGGIGAVNYIDVLKFCDAIYYGVVAKMKDKEIQIAEGELVLETIKMAVSKLLKEMDVFEGLDCPEMDSVPKNAAKSPKESETEIYAGISSGSKKISYKWDDRQTLNIPNLATLADYVPSEYFFLSLAKIYKRLNRVLERVDGGATGIEAIGQDYINFFVTGRPGTGKTTMAYALAAALGMPVYSVPMTKGTEEDTFQGVTKVIDGKLQFVSTDFLDAYEHGGIIVLEEINLADPSVIMGALGQAVESPFILQKNGFETVHRHPLCVIIGTMNIGTYGSKCVNQALSSRFKQSYMLDDPKKEDFVNILMKHGADKAKANWVYDIYDTIITALKSDKYNAEDMTTNITLRGCLGALENMEEGESPKNAIRDTLVGKIAESDLEIARSIYEEVVCNFPPCN